MNKQLFRQPNRILIRQAKSGFRLDWWFYGTSIDTPELEAKYQPLIREYVAEWYATVF